jgi:hypothetical protein
MRVNFFFGMCLLSPPKGEERAFGDNITNARRNECPLVAQTDCTTSNPAAPATAAVSGLDIRDPRVLANVVLRTVSLF